MEGNIKWKVPQNRSVFVLLPLLLPIHKVSVPNLSTNTGHPYREITWFTLKMAGEKKVDSTVRDSRLSPGWTCTSPVQNIHTKLQKKYQRRRLLRLYCVSERHGAMVQWYRERKTKELEEESLPVPLCPPQISHALAWYRTRASTMRGRRLAPCHMKVIVHRITTKGPNWISSRLNNF